MKLKEYFEEKHLLIGEPIIVNEDQIKEMNDRFIDKEDLMKFDLGTVFGLELHKIQKMIDFFRKEDYNPYNWEEFEEQLKHRQIKKCHLKSNSKPKKVLPE